MSSFRGKHITWISCLTAAGLAVSWIAWNQNRQDLPPPTPQPDTRNQPSSSAGATNDDSRNRIDRALRESGKTIDPASLRADLLAAPKSDASAAILEFLRSGRDQSTGLEFEIGPGGEMKSWPTLRTMMLDLLAAIDPEAAAVISREILAKPTSADEWAIALRNLGRGERSAENDAFLVARTAELIQRAEWQESPSVGYLNAFDVLVHLEAIGETPLLSNLVQRKERKDLAHAAFLTLDRLVQRQPADMLTRLAGDKALQESRPEMTAQQFARADLRDPQQRDLLKRWLLDPARTPAEIQSFTGVYPNQNRFVSNNLLTEEITMSGAELAAHDQEALRILESWSADPEFEPVRDHLQSMTQRLKQFVQQPAQPLANP
jgi:hypothetical protein